MSIDHILCIILILIALLISYYIIVIKLGNDKKLSNSQQQYSGIAREPEKLSAPSEAASKALDKLIQKIANAEENLKVLKEFEDAV